MDQHKKAGVNMNDYNGYNNNNQQPIPTKKSGHKARGSIQIGNIYPDDENPENLQRDSEDENDDELMIIRVINVRKKQEHKENHVHWMMMM